MKNENFPKYGICFVNVIYMAKVLFEVDGGSQVGGHFEIHSWELMRAHACAFECARVYL